MQTRLRATVPFALVTTVALAAFDTGHRANELFDQVGGTWSHHEQEQDEANPAKPSNPAEPGNRTENAEAARARRRHDF